ncbi:MAG: two-component system response regulator [Candidatus Omnitrophica bacterium CG11_big_fil_rev_8_21_14_0_20_45_26]|uniref:Two-component system response regulator n=1 Tax=Candidatus Abzuiibacterium crystallinum TaxID=1974748 RepID=A0A2H0LT70_9BACT|nr:MAG: two-component system response regulator [Candidatus Omnitrophica bacterium CG11_big_fil_rev_8_21_14_0_20_45_26]PIW64376.1 MAG: two-component system response regulator [Candidatus Omnitrophica bacterium CG12_big_fil_rev_8_21_14_0_65_45_16]
MKKILVVEDDPDLRELLKMRLEANHYEVVLAENGEDGLTKAETEKPDLIMLDVMMPTLDGYTMSQDLGSNEHLRHIPLIVMTGKQYMEELFQSGQVKAFFTKPIDTKEVLKKIKSVLGE